MRELEEKKPINRLRSHTLMLDNRERVVITGVEDVDNFDEQEINVVTEAGYITLQGHDLHINKLNLDEGQLVIEGFITMVQYADPRENQKTGLFGRIFR